MDRLQQDIAAKEPPPAGSAIQHHYAQVNGLRMHYASCGEPGKPLLLFIHGFPEFWYGWKAQLAHFADDYYAVAPDMRGINLSEGPAELKGYRVRNMVEDVRALIAHLGYERCVLVGHDWGGAISWAFGMAYPQHLHGMVMINAVHPGPYARELVQNPAQQAASAYMNFFCTPQADAELAKDGHAYLFGMFAEDSKLPAWMDATEQEAYVTAWSRPGSVKAGLDYYRASPLHPSSGEDKGASAVTFEHSALMVNVPTLLVWGERDRFLLTDCLDGLEAYVPQLRIVRIPDASHWIVHERPDEIHLLIGEFAQGRLAN